MQSKRVSVGRIPLAAVLVALAASPLFPALAADGAVSADFHGRLHLDFADFHNDDRGRPNPDDTEVRRAWLSVSGKLHGFKYKLEGDFADLDDIVARDVYLSRAFGDAGVLTVGQFKQHYSLDDRISSNWGSFMERSSAAATLAPLYRLGAMWQARPGDMTWAASGYSLESIDVTSNKGFGLAARATWAPPAADAGVLHLGLSLIHEHYQSPGANGHPGVKIRPRPAGHLSDNSRMTLVDFSAGRDTRVNKWALEYAQGRGPVSWQAEWSGATFADGMQHGDVQAAYGMLSWFPTGESRPYDRKNGRFGRLPSLNHRGGAFELALRYDTMWGDQHLDGQPLLRSGRTSSVTVAGNWYLRPNLRLMLDLIQSHNRDRLHERTLDRTRAVTGRFQYDF